MAELAKTVVLNRVICFLAHSVCDGVVRLLYICCTAVINLVKFVLSNETVLLKKFDVFVLCTRVSDVTDSAVLCFHSLSYFTDSAVPCFHSFCSQQFLCS